jgi:hypothetical protein
MQPVGYLDLFQLKDSDVLAVATQQGRILVSHDFGTMPRHFRSFVSRQKSQEFS